MWRKIDKYQVRSLRTLCRMWVSDCRHNSQVSSSSASRKFSCQIETSVVKFSFRKRSVRNMAASGPEAEEKFWKTPELVEGLLPHLDPPSTLELAKVHPLTSGILQGISDWNRFIRRSCPFPPPNSPTSSLTLTE